MSVLCIAVGNPWRGDDGAAHRVLELIAPAPGLTRCGVLQLTPELAAEVARVEAVLFIDADVSAEEPSVERLTFGPVRGTPLAHSMTAAEVVYWPNAYMGSPESRSPAACPPRDSTAQSFHPKPRRVPSPSRRWYVILLKEPARTHVRVPGPVPVTSNENVTHSRAGHTNSG